MKSFFGILVIALYVSSSAALPPCVCTRNLRPVCGSDGVTYSNECLLNCENHKTNKGITVAKQGSCEPTEDLCICTLEYRPVCGSDGETYPNACSAGCSHVEVASKGACSLEKVEKVVVVEQPQPACTCTKEKRPVCGSDGVTYSNDCLLNCATAKDSALRIASQGPCQSDKDNATPKLCVCGRNLLPVCSTDGVTYSNECLLNCDGKQLSKVGACDESQVKFVNY